MEVWTAADILMRTGSLLKNLPCGKVARPLQKLGSAIACSEVHIVLQRAPY